MKRRMLILALSVVLCVMGWRSGVLWTLLQRAGEWAALSALSRSPLPGETVRLETGQGYEEGLLISPPRETESESSSTAPVVDLSMNNGKYTLTEGLAVKNGTSKEIDIAALLEKGFEKPTLSENEPVVLIYHTHGTESYADAGSEYSKDWDKGVIGVGEEMKKEFEAAGLQTLHLTENYIDTGPFKKAYTRSLAGVEAALKKHPSIRIVLDIHRDSIADGDTQYCPLITIDGKEYAQIMLISGTNELGLSHPHWEENFRFALALSKKLQTDYPDLSRPINLNPNRYNTHTTPYALLMEVGSSANTSTQAKRAGGAVAKSIAEMVS